MLRVLVLVLVAISLAIGVTLFFGPEFQNTTQVKALDSERGAITPMNNEALLNAQPVITTIDSDNQSAPQKADVDSRGNEEMISDSVESLRAQAELYSQDLGDEEARAKLSSSLKNDQEYKDAILEKFKQERDAAAKSE